MTESFDYKGMLIPFSDLVANIERVFTAATQEETLAGATWYMDAHYWANVIAMNTNTPISIVTLVIAALSPRHSWVFSLEERGNLQSALIVIEAWKIGLKPEDVKVSTFNTAKIKAFDILNDFGKGVVDLDYYFTKYFKGSPKTWNFARNILDPYSNDWVTIDGHATHIAVTNERLALDKAVKLDNKNRYELLVRAYRTVADKFGVKAWQVQAITWTVYR